MAGARWVIDGTSLWGMQTAFSATLTLRESIEYSASQHIPIGYYSRHYSVIVLETSRYVCALRQQVRIAQRVTVNGKHGLGAVVIPTK